MDSKPKEVPAVIHSFPVISSCYKCFTEFRLRTGILPYSVAVTSVVVIQLRSLHPSVNIYLAAFRKIDIQPVIIPALLINGVLDALRSCEVILLVNNSLRTFDDP